MVPSLRLNLATKPTADHVRRLEPYPPRSPDMRISCPFQPVKWKAPAQGGGFWISSGQILDGDDVDSLQALRGLLNGEFHLLTLVQGSKAVEAVVSDPTVVHENIFAIFAFDESVAFSVVEPLDRTKNSISHFLSCLLMTRFLFRRLSFSAVGFIEPKRPELQELRP
jgi:hypothetical protein